MTLWSTVLLLVINAALLAANAWMLHRQTQRLRILEDGIALLDASLAEVEAHQSVTSENGLYRHQPSREEL